MHSPFANFTLLQPTSIMAFVVDFFSAAFEFDWILMLVRCNLDLGKIQLQPLIQWLFCKSPSFNFLHLVTLCALVTKVLDTKMSLNQECTVSGSKFHGKRHLNLCLFTDSLISESFSLRLQSLKKRCQITPLSTFYLK